MKVFISYTTPDEGIAKRVYREVKKFFPCWIACEDLTISHEIAIQQELAAEDAVMVALLSNNTFTSPGQKKEFRIADNFRTETIPVLIEDISEVLSEVEYNLRNRIPDNRAFVPYVMHSGQFYLGYKDPEWFDKVLMAIHAATGTISDTNPVLAKLRRAHISVEASSRKEILTIWNLEGKPRPPIHIVFDARPTKVMNQTRNWEEFISVRGIVQTKGCERQTLLKAIQAFVERGQWGLKDLNPDSLEFEIINGFQLPMSAPPAVWRSCCEDICANFSELFAELDELCAERNKPRSLLDNVSDVLTGIFNGITEGVATGLSIAEQLGIFDQDDEDDSD